MRAKRRRQRSWRSATRPPASDETLRLPPPARVPTRAGQADTELHEPGAVAVHPRGRRAAAASDMDETFPRRTRMDSNAHRDEEVSACTPGAGTTPVRLGPPGARGQRRLRHGAALEPRQRNGPRPLGTDRTEAARARREQVRSVTVLLGLAGLFAPLLMARFLFTPGSRSRPR